MNDYIYSYIMRFTDVYELAAVVGSIICALSWQNMVRYIYIDYYLNVSMFLLSWVLLGFQLSQWVENHTQVQRT